MSFINFSVLLFFGINISASFLKIAPTKKNILLLLVFGAADLSLQGLALAFFDMNFIEKFYPLITHLPLLLLFVLCFKQKILPSLFAILSAYLCCQVTKWLSLVMLSLSGELWLMYAARIAVTIPVGIVIIRLASISLHTILTKSSKTLLIFGLLPAVYYVFDYIATVYTEMLYSGSQVVSEFLPFVLCIAYLLFSVVYFREYEEKRAAEQQKKLNEIQTAQSIKEIEEIKRSKYEISLIRHDMRHFLSNVSVMIENGEIEKAQEYIRGIIDVTDQTVVLRYCENDTVNLLLSYYEGRMADKGVRFDASVEIPAVLPCSELEFTSILSNGLENALNAVSSLEEKNRKVGLKLGMKNEKLLLSVQNAFASAPVFENGMPVTNAAGHGLGTQSIQYLTAKLNGNCRFSVENGLFTLRVVI